MTNMNESDKAQLSDAEQKKRENDPSFWLRDAELRMRENVQGLVAEMQRLPPHDRGNLPSIAHALLWVLDDLTKLSKAGFGMVPPGGPPPIAPSGPEPYNDPMESRVSKLEQIAQEVRERLARIEPKLDLFATKDDLRARLESFATKEDLQRELHAQTWRFVGVVTTLGLAVVGAMVWIAKNIS